MSAYDVNLSNGTALTTLYPLEANGPDNRSTPRKVVLSRPLFPISQIGAIAPNGVFKVENDRAAMFPAGLVFDVTNSTSNDGTYTVQSAVYNGGQNETDITVTGTIPSATADGAISINAFVLFDDLTYRFTSAFQFDVQLSGSTDGTYTVSPFNSYLVPAPVGSGVPSTVIPTVELIPPPSLPLGQIQYTNYDSRTTLSLVGKGTMNYGERVMENIVRMTEHFAADVEPENNTNIGTDPTAQPLTGQLWYKTLLNEEGFLFYDGTQWTNVFDYDSGAIVFRDVEDSNKDIYITASETNLPAPWTGGANNEPGLVVWNQTDPVDDEPVFRVLSSSASELLRVEYNSTANNGYIRTVNNVEVQGQGDSFVYGTLSIGQDGLPTQDRTLTVEGDGIAVNSDAGMSAVLDLDASTNQMSLVSFSTQGTVRGTMYVDDSEASTPLRISSVSELNAVAGTSMGLTATTDVSIDAGTNITIDAATTIEIDGTTLYVDTVSNLVGIGAVPVYDFDVAGPTRFQSPVGINNPPPSGSPVWLEVTGDIQANSQFRGTDGSLTDPTYSFTGDLDTGLSKISGGIALVLNGVAVVHADIAGNITVTSPFQMPSDVVAYSFSDADDVGMQYSLANDELWFMFDGATQLSIDSNGVVSVHATDYETLVVDDDNIPNKKYVDDKVNSTSWREPVRVRDISLYANSAAFPTTGTIDGVALAVDDRVLFNNVTATGDKDIFIWNGATWDRDEDTVAPGQTRTVGDVVYVNEGTGANKLYAYGSNGDWTDLTTQSITADFPRNAIINPNFDVWQRNSSFSITTSAFQYTADRWAFETATGNVTVQPSTDVPTEGSEQSYFVNVDVVATASSDETRITYAMETQDFRRFQFGGSEANAMTLSFWVKSDVAGTYCISFRSNYAANPANTHSFVAEYTVDVAGTWEYKTITVPGYSTGGVLPWTSGEWGIVVDWWLNGVGTATAGSWIDDVAGATHKMTSNQTTLMSTVNNEFRLSRVQLEVGESPTLFEYRQAQQELEMCYRYYAKTYDQNVFPGTVSVSGDLHFHGMEPIGPVIHNISWDFPVSMRTIPNIRTYSWSSGGSVYNGSTQFGSVYTNGAGFIGDETVSSVQATTSRLSSVAIVGGGSANSGITALFSYHATADAEIY